MGADPAKTDVWATSLSASIGLLGRNQTTHTFWIGGSMYLSRLRLKNFQSFGPTPKTIDLEEDTTFLLGSNGSGKTAAMVALARMFAVEPSLRQVRLSDFHVDLDGVGSTDLWVETEFVAAPHVSEATIPAFFDDMRLFADDGHPRVRIRLQARIDDADEVIEQLVFVTDVDTDDEPTGTSTVSAHDRRSVQVHYLPARRDPRQHLEHSTYSMLGRLLRSIDWTDNKATVADLSKQISDAIGSNGPLKALAGELDTVWKSVHSGTYFQTPALAFAAADLSGLLRHLTVAFSPAPGQPSVEWTRLSDGEQSAFYLSLVLALHSIGQEATTASITGVDAARLRAPSYSILAIEEPENSLSPHHLGRIMRRVGTFAADGSAQVVMSSHSPAVVHRTPPTAIRCLRLDDARTSQVTKVDLPPDSDEAYKFVSQAVQAYPELYFARLVILGEGDSEQAVLPRLIEAHDIEADTSCVSVVPLGGRHVNHFWRLLNSLQIPYITLLDLDLGRHGGGWGRVRDALKYLKEFPGTSALPAPDNDLIDGLPSWDDPDPFYDHARHQGALEYLEARNVFFSAPLDLDFAMIRAFPKAYNLDDDLEAPDNKVLASVLGKSVVAKDGTLMTFRRDQYAAEELTYFSTYHQRFKLGSKPAEHLEALTRIPNPDLKSGAPAALLRVAAAASARLKELPA